MHPARTTLVTLALASVLLLLGGARRSQGAWISWAEVDPPTTLHPLYPATRTDTRLHALMYDRLFTRSSTGDWSSPVAESHEVLEGGGVRIQLRSDIKWHDGVRLTGRDVCYTVTLLRAPAPTSPIAQRLGSVLQRCEVGTDPQEVTVHLASRPLAEPRAYLTFPILPAHVETDVAARPGHALSAEPVGTGPMRFASSGQRWLLESARAPHRPSPFQAMELAVLDSAAAAARALVNDGVTGLPEVAPREVARVRAGGIPLVWYPRRELWILALQTREGPLADIRVREAIDRLLDRAALRDEAVGVDPDRAEQVCHLASGPFLRGSSYYNSGIPVPTADAEQARTLLLAAGAERVDGAWHLDGQPIRLRLVAPAFSHHGLSIAEAVARRLRGFTVEIERVDALRWWTEGAAGALSDRDIVVMPWHVPPDEDLTALLHSPDGDVHRSNWLRSARPSVDALLEAHARASGPAEARAAYRELHAVLADDRAWLTLWQLDAWSAWAAPVLHAPASEGDLFGDLHLWQVASRRR